MAYHRDISFSWKPCTWIPWHQVAALVSRLEKSAPKNPEGRTQCAPPTTTPEQAPEPLRRAMSAAQEAEMAGKPLARNPSSHSGGILPRGVSNGKLTSTANKFENIPVSFPVVSPFLA